MADLLIKTNLKYLKVPYHKYTIEMRRRKGGGSNLLSVVRSGDKEDELKKHVTSYTSR